MKKPNIKKPNISLGSFSGGIGIGTAFLCSIGYFAWGGISGVFGALLLTGLLTANLLLALIPFLGVPLQCLSGWFLVLPFFQGFTGLGLCPFAYLLFFLSIALGVFLQLFVFAMVKSR